MEIIFIILLLFVTWFNFRVHGKIMAPAVLFSLVWTAALLFQLVCKYTLLTELYSLNLNTLLLFTGGVMAFSLGSLLFYMVNNKRVVVAGAGVRINIPPISFLFRLILVGFCAVTLPFFIQKAFLIFLQSEVDNFFVGLRYEIFVNEADYGPLKYMLTVSFVVYALCQLEALRERTSRNRLLAICSFFISFAFAVFSSGRTFFLLLGTIFLGLQVILNPSFKVKKLFWIIPLFVLLFAGYGLLFGKGRSASDDSTSDLLNSTAQYTALYVVGSLNAQDYELNHQFHPNYNGYNSLRFFYVVGTALGLIGPVNFSDNLMQEYVMIPYLFNVYTFYSPYLKDFGYGYPIVILLILGWFQTWLFYKAVKGSARGALYYSVFLYPLVMSFFQDQYFSLLSTWIQCFVMVEAILFLNLLFIKKSVVNAFAVKADMNI